MIEDPKFAIKDEFKSRLSKKLINSVGTIVGWADNYRVARVKWDTHKHPMTIYTGFITKIKE